MPKRQLQPEEINSIGRTERYVAKLSAIQTSIGLVVLGIVLIIITIGSFYLAFVEKDEPIWVAPVVSSLVGSVAGYVAGQQTALQSNGSKSKTES